MQRSVTSKWTSIGFLIAERYAYFARNIGTCHGLNLLESIFNEIPSEVAEITENRKSCRRDSETRSKRAPSKDLSNEVISFLGLN